MKKRTKQQYLLPDLYLRKVPIGLEESVGIFERLENEKATEGEVERQEFRENIKIDLALHLQGSWEDGYSGLEMFP